MEIWKFKVGIGRGTVSMPKGADVLSAGLQGHTIMVWARVDPSADMMPRKVHVYGTGHIIAGEDVLLTFVGTVFDGPYVLHVFDGGEVRI